MRKVALMQADQTRDWVNDWQVSSVRMYGEVKRLMCVRGRREVEQTGSCMAVDRCEVRQVQVQDKQRSRCRCRRRKEEL